MPSLLPVPFGVVTALLAAFFFGVLTTLARLFYEDGGNVLTLMLFRFSFGTLVLLVLARAHLRVLGVRRLAGVLVVGVAWSLGVSCYLASVHYIEVGIAALIFYTFPVIVLILSLVMREVHSTLRLWTVFLAAFGGLALMLLPSISHLSPVGLLFACGAASFIAAAYHIGAHVSPGVAAPVFSFWVMAVGLVLTSPVLFWSSALALPQSGWGWLWLGAGTVLYLTGVLCQFSAMARLRAVQMGMIMNLEPLVAVALATWVLGERLTPLQWLGVATVIGALLLSQRALHKATPAAGPSATPADVSQDRDAPQS